MQKVFKAKNLVTEKTTTRPTPAISSLSKSTIPFKGIPNAQFNCYLIAAIQLINSCKLLVDYMNESKFEDDLVRGKNCYEEFEGKQAKAEAEERDRKEAEKRKEFDSTKDTKSEKELEAEKKRRATFDRQKDLDKKRAAGIKCGDFARRLARLFNALNSKEADVTTPFDSLLQLVRLQNPDFVSDFEHDSEEALILLLTKVSSDLRDSPVKGFTSKITELFNLHVLEWKKCLNCDKV